MQCIHCSERAVSVVNVWECLVLLWGGLLPEILSCSVAIALSGEGRQLMQVVNHMAWFTLGFGFREPHKVSNVLLFVVNFIVCEVYLANVVIWLILPVVICLSQRLSHACVSISIIRRNCEWLIKSVIIYLIIESYMDNRDKLQLIHAFRPRPRVVIISTKPFPSGMWWFIVIERTAVICGKSFKFLPYQLWMVVYWTTMAVTGNGELGFDSGEGAWETATTSTEGSRRENCPIPTRGGSDKK